VFDESDVFGTLTATRIYLLLENASIDFGSQSSFPRKLYIFSKETLQYSIATETVSPGTTTDFSLFLLHTVTFMKFGFLIVTGPIVAVSSSPFINAS